MRIAYIRVSTEEQNEARQIEALKGYNIERWYTEKISGRTTRRPKLQEMLDFAREGDEIYILDFSRLARNTKDLLDIMVLEYKGGKKKKINKDDFDTYYARYQRREITKTQMAAALKISRPTLDRRLRECERV